MGDLMQKGRFFLVNFVTSLRVVGIFLLIPLFFKYGGLAVGILNIFCFLTDFLDGRLATWFKCATFFGSIYDGLADKAFLAVNLALLIHFMPWAILSIILELIIIIIQYLKYRHNLNVKSSFLGKIKMWVAGICIIVIDFSLPQVTLGKRILMVLIVFEILTIISYLKEYKLAKQNTNEKRKVKTIENYTLKEALFSPDFYQKHKNDDGLMLLKSGAKKILKKN